MDVRFKLIPPRLDNVDLTLDDPELVKLDATYRICYYSVFGEFPKTPKLPEKLVREIGAVIGQRNITARLYLLALMYAHREASPERTFHPALLVSAGAVGRIEHYRRACAHAYGTFDVTSFELLTKLEHAKFDAALVHSETLFASYLSAPAAVANFYRDFELSLNKYWCAIERTYMDLVLIPHVKKGSRCSEAISRHRHTVALAHAQLKRSRPNAVAVFEARNQAASKVLRQLVTEKQLESARLNAAHVVDAAEFWSLLHA